jgi:hypothetical protein
MKFPISTLCMRKTTQRSLLSCQSALAFVESCPYTEASRKEGAVRCRERLGGLLKYYEREAA